MAPLVKGDTNILTQIQENPADLCSFPTDTYRVDTCPDLILTNTVQWLQLDIYIYLALLENIFLFRAIIQPSFIYKCSLVKAQCHLMLSMLSKYCLFFYLNKG